MSVEVIVYIRDNDLPSHNRWQRAIDDEGIDLQMDEFSTREHLGFVPAKLNGQSCGFEYFFHPVEPSEEEDFGTELGGRDRSVCFRFHGNEIDGQAAMLSAAVLTKLTNGVFFDPQGGGFATGDGVFTLVRQDEQSERDRRMRLAEQKWGHTTSRRCPTCRAPCPEYRNKCSVCGFVLGRA